MGLRVVVPLVCAVLAASVGFVTPVPAGRERQPPAFVWLGEQGLTADGREAIELLASATDDGLVPADYGVDDLRSRAVRLTPATAADAAERAVLDARLTDAFTRFLRDLHQGRVDPRRIGWQLDVPDDHHDFAALLHEAVRAHRLAALVDAQRPALAQYKAVRAAFQRYRALAGRSEPNLPPLPAPHPGRRSVHPGDPYPGVALVAQRLIARADLAADAAVQADRYDGVVVDGVRRFQARHGLEPDGVLGPATWTALSVPLAWRTQQLSMTLERLRWLPHLVRPRVIAINIPMFQLWAWDDPPDAPPAFTTGVIVGRALSTATPVMARELREIVFRPYWNVPRSILLKEILPAVRRDPSYLAQHDLELVAGAGDGGTVVESSAANLQRLARGDLRLRQRRGPRNSLGLVKFVFPNEADVYMHGTPATALFARTRRDFSHGCVRVQAPAALAAWVLAADQGWTPDRVEAAMQAAHSEHVVLRTPVQVLLFYTTAAVLPDGSVRFAEDIYQHDLRLDRALRERAVH